MQAPTNQPYNNLPYSSLQQNLENDQTAINQNAYNGLHFEAYRPRLNPKIFQTIINENAYPGLHFEVYRPKLEIVITQKSTVIHPVPHINISPLPLSTLFPHCTLFDRDDPKN